LAANYYLIYNYYLNNNNALNPVTIVVNSEKPTASDEKSVVVVNKEKTHPNIGHQAPASAEKQTKMEQLISTCQSDFLDVKIPTVLRNYEIEVFSDSETLLSATANPAFAGCAGQWICCWICWLPV
jgi:hypothetical protein